MIALASLFVAAGYFTLTFYDLFAVRAIGHTDIPYRINALAAFTSYSIGHNVGASVFTGGAVRYRIYSAVGLNAIDVAKICFLAGLTFWLGNAAVLGLGIAYHPEAATAIDQLPPWLNRLVAFGIILGLVAYVAWVSTRPRVVGRGPWTVVLPGGSLTLLQIVIGIVDLGFCALAMYVLVPDEPNLGFVVVAVIFVSATLLGFAIPASRISCSVVLRSALNDPYIVVLSLGWALGVRAGCGGSGPVEHDLAAHARAGGVERLLPLLGREAVGDDRGDGGAQPLERLRASSHGVPRVVHLAAVDALDGDHVRDDPAPVDRERVLGQTEHRHAPAVVEVGEHVRDGLRAAAHLQADVEALPHAELALGVGDAGARDVDRQVGAGLRGPGRGGSR